MNAARPADFNSIHARIFSQPECQRELRLRTVARAATHHLGLTPGSRFHRHKRTEAIAARFAAHGLDRNPVILVSTVVAENARGAVIVVDYDVEIAIAIEVAIRGPPSHDRLLEIRTGGFADVRELALLIVVKQERWFLKLNLLLNVANLLFNMPIRAKDIGPAIQVVVEKESAEREIQQGRPAQFRTRRLVDEDTVAFVVIKSKHLV